VHTYQQVMNCETDWFQRFFHNMLTRGVYLAPSAFEAGFVSAAHTDEPIEQTLEVVEQVFSHL
jgi:Glutamate-1-semialdehyde aminotransferase